MEHRLRRERRFVGYFLCFLAVSVLVFFGIQFIFKTGLFKIPGVVYLDDSLNADEISLINSIFTDDIVLDKDVVVSATYSLTMPEASQHVFLTQILVPVADYYSADDDINIDTITEEILSSPDYHFVDINDLKYTDHLLKLNNHFYLDEYSQGGIYRVVSFNSEKYDEEILPLVADKFTYTYPTKDTVLTFAQTGVTALSRGMYDRLGEVGDSNYFAESIGDYLSGFDLTHTSNEASFSDYASSRNICSDPRFLNTLLSIGVDIVELTGNHNLDCGVEAAESTIDLYAEHNILMVGGGKTYNQAKLPLIINRKGNDIMFLAYNLSTGGATEDDTPGANQYFEEDAIKNISEAKSQGKFVVVDVQYYECSAYDYEWEDTTCDYAWSSAGDQVGFFRHLIDLGADMVVGTSAHQPQTFELYGNGVIYYGLGNLFFDQYWWPGTTRSLILAHYFYNGKLLQTKIVPTVYDRTLQTRLMDEQDAKVFIQRLIDAKP